MTRPHEDVIREALAKLERQERLLDGRDFRPYPVRKRREALAALVDERDRLREVEKAALVMLESRPRTLDDLNPAIRALSAALAASGPDEQNDGQSPCGDKTPRGNR